MRAEGTQASPSRATLRRTPKSLSLKQNLTLGQIRRLETIQGNAPSVERAFLRCYEQKASPRQAIKGQCLDCQGLDREGGPHLR